MLFFFIGLKSVKSENAIKTIASRLYRSMTITNSFDWIGHLDDIVNSYNGMQQKVLKNFSPLEVVTDAKKAKILKNHYDKDRHQHVLRYDKPPKFLLGQTVRYQKNRETFDKFYTPQFSNKIEKIRKIINSSPPSYYITNSERLFYEPELQLVNSEDEKKHLYIDESKTLEARQTRNKKENSEEKKSFLMKSNLNPKFKKYISYKELIELEKNGVLLPHSNK